MTPNSKNIIIKTANNPIPGQMLMPHCIIWNDKISLECRGLIGTILSFEEGIPLNDLLDHFPDPEKKTRKVIKEALKSGFIREENGVFKGHITLYDIENFKL
jgi:hypothetical protein